MNILRDNNKMPATLQADLASYGLMRTKAKELAPKHTGTGPDYFGLRKEGDDYTLVFQEDITKLEDVEDRMQLAVVAPADGEMFDMLAPKQVEKLSFQDTNALRRFLYRLLDNV